MAGGGVQSNLLKLLLSSLLVAWVLADSELKLAVLLVKSEVMTTLVRCPW